MDRGVVTGQAEIVAALEHLAEKLGSGELVSVSVRIYKADGTWQDVTLGGTEEQQAEALAELRRLLAGAH